MLLTVTLAYKLVYKRFSTLPNSHDKGKNIVMVFVDLLHNQFDDPGAVHDII